MRRGNAFWRLVKYECRKAFWNPWMLVFILVLLVFNGWKLHDTYTQKVDRWAEYQEVYDVFYSRCVGPITAEKVSDFMTVYAPLQEKAESFTLNKVYDPAAYTYSEQSDYSFFTQLFYAQMHYDYFYVNEAHRITTRAMELADFYSGAGNAFEVSKNLKIAADFSGRSIPEFGDTRGYEVLMHYDYSAMLVLLLTIFGLCGIFVTERETQMYMLLRTTQNGSGTTMIAKLITAALFAVLMSGMFFLQDFLTIYLLGGRNQALDSPVYALRYFETTPLNMTIGQYFLWAGIVKTLGVFASGCVILLVSSLCRQMLTAFFISFVALLCGVVLQEFCRTRYALKWFNPLELVIVRDIAAESAYVDLFGFAVHLHVFVTAGILLTMGLLVAGILYCNRSYHRRGRRRAVHVQL